VTRIIRHMERNAGVTVASAADDYGEPRKRESG
jgi:hypothetical protein